MKKNQYQRANTLVKIAFMLLLTGALIGMVNYSSAEPTGATIVSNVTETAASRNPDGLTDARGTVNTLTLNAVQQVQNWKAYIGNVSGRFTLADADGFTIYDWEFGNASVEGEVYASRNDSIEWSQVGCANTTTIGNEETSLNMTGSSSISISSTFNETTHAGFFVGPVQISSSSCPSTFTYFNNSIQNPSASAPFQQILLQDDNNLVYTTIIDDDRLSYRNDTTYDFQMILGESAIQSASTYYFYVELGG